MGGLSGFTCLPPVRLLLTVPRDTTRFYRGLVGSHFPTQWFCSNSNNTFDHKQRVRAAVAPTLASTEASTRGDANKNKTESFWSFRLNNILFAFIAASAVGSTTVAFYGKTIKHLPFQIFPKHERDELFRIQTAPEMTFARDKQKKLWKKFIKRSLSDPTIWWLYGDENIGKSTMLQNVVYELQQESQETKLKYIYLNLSKQSNHNHDHEDSAHMCEQLRKLLKENASQGFKCCVVLDSIDRLLKYVDGTEKMDPNISIEEYRKIVRSSGDWVHGLFAHFKGSYDDKEASFIILTSIPQHLAIDTMICDRIRVRAIRKDVNKTRTLNLKLSERDAITFVQQQLSNHKEAPPK